MEQYDNSVLLYLFNQKNKKIMKRIDAARQIHALYNSMEARKVKLCTIYRGLVKLANGNYHYCGVGYDYTA